MGRELGRISGPLLAENLLRNGNNLAFDTDLLYLDVVNRRIGFKTDTPTRDLLIPNNADTTNLIVDTLATIADFEFTTNQIQNVTGGITFTPFQGVDPTVTAPNFRISNLEFSSNALSNLVEDSNIILDPNGSGRVIFTSNRVNVDGNLHATGDITWDGSIVFGNDNLDNVTFDADINSSIIPNVNNEFDIGSSDKEWQNLYAHNLLSTNLTTTSITLDGIDLLLTQGNTIYVSINGDDTNSGTNLHATYRSVKQALSQSVAGDEIVIFPGEYIEEFPLTVPQGVSVRGAGIRAVTIAPTVETNTEDAFLLNSETTVSFLTVKDFYAPGNGFSFAPNFTIGTRSPYVRNLTVITTGPNAGNGALVDGNLANFHNVEPAMLFDSVTMIVPDAIGIKATNGVRVEWLNCFTYFASKGIYLLAEQTNVVDGGSSTVSGTELEGGNSTTITPDVITGGTAESVYDTGGKVEFRSIDSANVYGTYGAVAEGANTLGYLIGHNFSYIGSGLDSQNDYGLVEQANEVVAINGGQLYYDSTDQKGDYRIGDIFLVEQSTGKVSFNAQTINYAASGSIALEGLGGRTFIHAPAVEVGNIRIYDNNIDSQTGPVNLLAFSGSTYLNTNVAVTGSVDITGDTNIKGTVTQFGNETTDTVTILDYLTQTIEPDVTDTYTLGKITGTTKVWDTLFATLINVDGVIQISNNTITTLTTDTDLEFIAAGTGIVSILKSVDITNNLTVTDASDLQAVGIVGTLDLPGAYTYTQTGAIGRTGDTSITGNITVNGTNIVQFQDIKFDSNKITTTLANNDLKFTANGTGIVKVINSDVQVDNDLAVSLTGYFGTVSATTVTANAYDISSVYITGNTITTDTLDTDLVLSANGTGIVNVADSVTITNNLTVNQSSTLASVGIVGSLDLPGLYTYTQTGAISRTGDTSITGNITVNGTNIVQFPEINFDSNRILTTNGDTDLKFTANGTGIVKVINSDVQVDNDLAVNLDGFFGSAQVNNTITSTDLYIDSIHVFENTIVTLGTDTNLVLSANNLGEISVPTTDVTISNNLTVNSNSLVADVGIIGTLNLTGNYTYNQTGDNNRIGNTDITGNLTVSSYAEFENINIASNVITTITAGSDLILEATGTITVPIDGGPSLNSVDIVLDGGSSSAEQLELINGGSSATSYDTIVNFINTDVEIENNLNVLLDITTNSAEVTQGVVAFDFNIGDLYIKNTISVVPGNTSLVLGATGNVRFKTSDVSIENDLTVAGPFTVNGTSDILYTSISGIVTQTGNYTYNQSGSTDIIGTLQVDDDISITSASSIISVNAVKIDDNVISATTTNSDLQFRASGTGGVALERYLKITNNEITNIFDSNNIELAFNNLILTEDGQNLIVESGDFYLADTLLDGDLSVILTPNGTGNVVINSNKAFAVAYGNNSDRILKNVGEIRQNSITNVYEGKLGTGLVKFNNIYDTVGNTYITPELTPGANDDTIRFGINGVVKASVDSTKLFSNTLYAGSVSISGTTISTLNSANELLLLPSGAGVVKFNNVSFIEDYITNNTNSALVLASTGTGYVKFNGNNGIVFPSGAESLRYATPELGETRYNTEGSYLEIFDGSNWISASGTSNVATLDEVQAELDLWSLVLG